MIAIGAGLLLAAIAALVLAAPVALADRRASYGLSLLGSLVFVAAGIDAVAFGGFTALSWSGVAGEPASLGLDALAGFFAIVAGIVWAATSAYSIGYDRDRGPSLAVAYAFTLVSIALLLAATDWLLFLAAWEAMTLASYWMILEAHGRAESVYGAAYVFLAFGEASTLLVGIAIGTAYAATGTFAMVGVGAGSSLASVVFVAALLGFGLKMGVAPFHMSEWLPIAHSSAPSNASAILSSTLTLAGAYGVFRILVLLPHGPTWWGALLLVIGAISALLGALFAAVSEHTKGLPAYSTIENNGLILVALGVGLVAQAEGLGILAAFAFFAAFFQAFAHAVTKATLFLFAGDVERSVRTFDLSRTRGAVKGADPVASGAAVVAALSLAAAPPLAGFVSEWMILESLFQSYRFSEPALQFIGLLSGAVVALAAGLVLVAMVKFVGFTALYRPRPDRSTERVRGLALPIAALGAVVVALGVFSPPILTFLAPSVTVLYGSAVAAPVGGLLAIPNGWSIVSGSPLFGILSPPALPIAFAIGALPAVAYYGVGRRPARRRVPAWNGGRGAALDSQAYTSFGYSTGLRIMLHSLLGTREVRRNVGTALARAEFANPEAYNVELEVLDVFKSFYDGIVRGLLAFADATKAVLMPGRVGRYLAYILVVLMVVIVYVAVAFSAGA